MIVFITTYMLILPAVTLVREKAAEMGGIDVPAEKTVQEINAGEVNAPETDGSTDADAEADADTVSEEDSESGTESDAGTVTSTDTDTGSEKETGQDDAVKDSKKSKAIEKNILTSDGRNYHVTVECGADSGVGEGAGLEVIEILPESKSKKGSADSPAGYSELVSKTEEALGISEIDSKNIRLFDIKIVDEKGEKIEIAAPVDVRIELSDMKSDADIQVVHIPDGSDTGDVVSDVEVDGSELRFAAEGFSAYAIVEGLAPVNFGWNQIRSMTDLKAHMAEGVVIGHQNGFYFTDTEDIATNNAHGIKKTKPAQSTPADDAAKYYLEEADGADQYYIYCMKDGQKYYIQNNNAEHVYLTADGSGKTAFTIKAESNGHFSIRSADTNRYINHWQDNNGLVFAAWTANNGGSKLDFWFYNSVEGEPYGLDGTSYGLMNWNGGLSGRAMMAESPSSGALEALPMTVMSKTGNNSDKLFVPDDSDITMWKFKWIEEDKYYLTAYTDGGEKYLRVGADGLSLVSTPDSACVIQVIPGSGAHENEVCLKSGNTTLTYSGSVDSGFRTGGSAGSEWLKLVEKSELTSDYFLTYSASKVSVSDTQKIQNGQRIIIYTRVWNDTTKKYEFYAIDHDGSLVRCYESGDSIQWVGSRLNSMLWNFVEHTNADGTPNYYYDLYNQFSENYIAPQLSDGQILANQPIGIHLNGRRNGKYYTSVLAWDDESYAYSGLKVENGRLVSCPISEAEDFYFAIMEDIPVDDVLHTVPTVDHTLYGISMKMTNFGTRKEMSDYLGNDQYTNGKQNSGLLSTNLDENGYPTAKGGSLQSWFNRDDTQDVNHLFIESIYNGSGYFEYDSSQNFAHLNGSTGDFTVYKEMGTMDPSSVSKFYTHGQFMPYNDLHAGVFSSISRQNLTDATGKTLPESDPRKYEQLYLVQNPDYYMGMELSASFTQTPNGLDAWDHDIIYEFTGDDDFWLYVDGELVIDLGGIHDALPGSVNYSTGEVSVNGKNTTLYQIFYDNYKGRGHSDEEAQAYVDEIFQTNDRGQKVFKDFSTHTMKIFYLERGAGASNLHMRFNLASVKPGTVLLNKEITGVEDSETILAEFPYQIWYTIPWEDGDDSHEGPQEHLLTQSDSDVHVYYKDTVKPVTFKESYTVGGVTYPDVFILKPGETAEIELPLDTIEYRIVECGVNTDIYDRVTVNGEIQSGTPATEGGSAVEGRKDYGIGYMASKDRPRVNYENRVDPEALHTLTIKKKLYAEDGVSELRPTEDDTTFDLRLYLATESGQFEAANMHPYFVRDPEGHYCVWDSTAKKLKPTSKTDFDDMTDAEKTAATFHTSIYGSVSKIPAFYSVEVRNVLVETKFRAVERAGEIPDGYDLQKYVYYPDGEAGEGTEGKNEGVIVSGEDPQVDVCNLRGFGLRVNKVWSDADYMTDRDPIYFALYTRAAGSSADDPDISDLTLVPGSGRVMNYGTDTLYWYYLHLPVPGVLFDRYEIREVRVTDDPEVDDSGVLSDASITGPVMGGDKVSLGGMQKGETERGSFEYAVAYTKGTPTSDSHVRVDTVTNDRPGVVLKKSDWDGEPLAGAEFTLKEKDTDTLIGTFTSDEDGQITVAFLSDDKDYTLTETKAPKGYHGLEASADIRLSGGTVSVSGIGEEWYSITGNQNGSTPVITVKNRTLGLQIVKQGEKADGSTEILSGVPFELHREVTVDTVTSMELDPMPGYEDLVSENGTGIIPKLDESLHDPNHDRTFYLVEKSAKAGYDKLSENIRFTVKANGQVVITDSSMAALSSETDPDTGKMTYTITVKNLETCTAIRIIKTDQEGKALEGAVFSLSGNGIDESGLESKIPEGGTDAVIYANPKVAAGTYTLTETQAPDGFIKPDDPMVIKVENGSTGMVVTAKTGDKDIGYPAISRDQKTGEWTIKVMNSAGVELPHAGGIGTTVFYVLGSILAAGCAIFLISRRRLHNN